MNYVIKTLSVSATLIVASAFSTVDAATAFDIPTTTGAYIDLKNADVENARTGGSGADQCFESTGAATVVTMKFNNTVEQPYTFIMWTGHKGECKINAVISDESGAEIAKTTFNVANTNSWNRTQQHTFFITSPLPVGTYTMTLKPSDLTGSGYAGNWGKMGFYAGIVDNRDHIPGTISLANGQYIGARTENNDTNVGYIKNDCSASYEIFCDQAGVYDLSWGITRYDGGVANISVADADGNITASAAWPIANLSNYEKATVHIPGEIKAGENTLKVLFNSTSGGFLVNYNNLEMTRIGDHYAAISDIRIAGQTVTAGEGCAYNCNLPLGFSEQNVTLSFTKSYGDVSLTAVDAEGNPIALTKNSDGTYSMPAPAVNTESLVTLTLTPEAAEGIVCYKTVYTLRLFQIGDIILNELKIDGKDAPAELLDALSAEPYSVTIDGVYTHIPALYAAFAHGQQCDLPLAELNGNNAAYTFTAKVGEIERTYSVNFTNVHVYNPTADDETIDMKFNNGTYDDQTKTWTNGLFTITDIDGGWNSEFKFPIRGEHTYTINVAPDAVVKQMIFKGFRDNYTGNTNVISAVTSGDAVVWLPADNRFYNTSEAGVRDLVVNLEGHKVGTPVSFTITSNGQMMSEFSFVIAHEAITTPPVVNSTRIIMPDNANHFVVEAKFDRPMASGKATIGGRDITPVAGSYTLYFPVWGLDYATAYDFTISEARDFYGNNIAAPVVINATTGQAPAVNAAEIEYVVSNVDELRAAVNAVNSSNNTPGAPRVVIFIKNGDYDLADVELRLTSHNVSLIGESRDGVILHGLHSGISNPVVSTRYSTATILQDMTIRNDLDWGLPRNGVGVALTSGNKEIGINLSLQSQQDTQVTDGNQSYYRDCEIYGAVDYVCGGGNQFYDNCHFIMTADGTIAAPSTATAHIWGYVFSNCTISALDNALDKGYSLARPWQNEPRTYWINTTMNVLPAGNGYSSMGNLPTHFYEYGSVDADGNLLDLSTRGNSPTHTGAPYTPILTDEQAAAFTIGNVLGYNDSYDAAAIATLCEAPAATIQTGAARAASQLNWSATDGARHYIIYRDGSYHANTTATSYPVEDDAVYTVRAANAHGLLSAHSSAVSVNNPTGIDTITTDTATERYYNLQGIELTGRQLPPGIYIVRTADTTRKLIIR